MWTKQARSYKQQDPSTALAETSAQGSWIEEHGLRVCAHACMDMNGILRDYIKKTFFYLHNNLHKR